MADRVHPMQSPPHPASPLPPPDQEDAAAATAATETTPLHPTLYGPPAPPPGTYIVQIPKDQVLRVPPPDRASRYKSLAERPVRRRRLRRAFFGTCGAVLFLALAAAVFVGTVYLVFRPRAPAFSVASLSIRGLDVAALPPSSLSPELDVALRADNGANRKVGVDYRGAGEVAVSYSGARLAAGQWPAFHQAPRNVTVFSTTLRGTGVSFSDEQRKQLAAEQAARAVPLTVEARVPVRLRFGKVLRTWTVDVKATCQVTVDKLAGEAAAANRGCRVKVRPFLWWWW
ncbi:NDR1/HIN1-like protein 13 [Aegilops tauschii subsp. strangulata]|nr:NDR1/HIN1-like protein 13 [Aegilops tauschii subsp. strangulata]XP_044401125.1 NDR1/HIN1-like protein 13 [Triticum aestivum]